MQLGTFVPIKDTVFCQVKKIVIHWGILPVGTKFEQWVIGPDVLSESGHVRRHLMNKERFHLWECPTDLCIKMKE